MNCKMCKNKGCVLEGRERELDYKCLCYEGKTNADRIRSMTDEELALFIHNSEAQAADIGSADTVKSWLDWLKQDYVIFVAQEYKKDLNDRLNREGISP